MEEVSIRLSCRGGDAGGVAGNASPPGAHTGRCLLGIAMGVPREVLLSGSCSCGVGPRVSRSGALATAAAILIFFLGSWPMDESK